MVLKDGAEALDGGGPLTCEGREECLAEDFAGCAECSECVLACGASGWLSFLFAVGSSFGKGSSFSCLGMGGSAANLCSQ